MMSPEYNYENVHSYNYIMVIFIKRLVPQFLPQVEAVLRPMFPDMEMRHFTNENILRIELRGGPTAGRSPLGPEEEEKFKSVLSYISLMTYTGEDGTNPD